MKEQRILSVLAVVSLSLSGWTALGAEYYVDGATGDDSNDGLS